MGTSALQIGQQLSGAALPIAYGPCRVRGNNLVNAQQSDNSRVALYVLGEGVWDGIDRLWINGKLQDPTNTAIVHFHNGFDGTLGHGLGLDSTGGDQLVDTFWQYVPNVTPTTLSRKAYLFVKVAPDSQAPSNSLDVVGDYRTSRVRIFDAGGNQTSYAYSLNPVWQMLDLILRTVLNREWTSSGAAAAGGDLSAFQKARINFQSFQTAAAICDTVLANGAKTFEGGIAYPSMTGAPQALDQLCTLSQTYLLDQDGQITLLPDEARASTFTLTSDHITAGSFQGTKSQLRAAANRFIGTFNDLLPQRNADIDTVGNAGLSRTSNVTTVKVPAGQVHGFLVNDNVDIVNPTDASFAGTIVVSTVIDSRTFSGAQTGANATSGGGYVGTTESRYAQRTKVIDHEAHQLAVGQRGVGLTPTYKRVPITIDFGNNTMERVERILNFIKTRNLGPDATPYIAPMGIKVQASAYSVDAANNALIAQLPGDIITIDSTISEEFQGQYEIMEMKYSRPAGDGSNSSASSAGSDQSGNAEVIDLTLLQYEPTAFSTLSNTAQQLMACLSRLGLVPVDITDPNQVQNGAIVGRCVGKNILGNPSWESNISATPIGVDLNAGDNASDEWFVRNKGSFQTCELDQTSGFARSGKTALLISMRSGQSIPNGANGLGVYETIVNTRAKIPVAVGKIVRAIGNIKWDFNEAIPAGLSIIAFVGVDFFDAGDNFLGNSIASAINAQNSSYAELQSSIQVPSTLSGTTPAYCRFVVGQSISNSSGAAVNTGAGLCADVRFDDLELIIQNTPFDLTPVSTTGTIIGGVNPLSQSGFTTTINVAASTWQFGETVGGQISYNSGTCVGGGFGTKQYVDANDPTYTGGAVTYSTTPTPSATVAAPGLLYFGDITLAAGGSPATGSGGGTAGGGPGGKIALA